MTRDPLTRRQFLQGVSALGAASALGACTSTDTPAATSPPGSGGSVPTAGEAGILVIVTLAGGNDALNTVVPVQDASYAGLRGALAVDPGTTHDVGEGFALHRSLTACKGLWDQGRLAVVHGVGFDGLDRSHFHCMDVWHAGDPAATTTGWIGRWLDAVSTDPLDALVIGRRSPLFGRGERRSAAVVPPGPFELPGDPALRDLLATMADPDLVGGGLPGLAVAATGDLLEVAAQVAPLLAETAADDSLAGQLDTVATCIEGGLPTRVYAVELGGFDTHANQADTHDVLLADLDAALDVFLARTADRAVTVLVYSEFGRRVAPNGSAGTDHGSAGTVLLAGRVAPGHHGEPPPLDRLTDGDLTTTVDFRSVYGGVLEGVLGIPAGDVLDRPPSPLILT